MDSKKLLKHKILKIEDKSYELVAIGYVEDVYDEVELKDIMKMVSTQGKSYID